MRLKIRRSVIACLLALMLALGVLPARPIRAEDAAASRHDMTYVNAVDVDIWEDGTSIYVKHKGMQRELASGTTTVNFKSIRDYLVTVETYQDSDGEQVTVIYFNIVFQHREDFFTLPEDVNVTSDGSSYRNIGLDSNSSLYSNDNARIFYVTIKGNEISDFVLARVVYGYNGMTPSAKGSLQSDTAYAEHSGRIYQTPFLQNKYKVYCSKPVCKDASGTELLIPETPLPAASR